MTHPTPDTLALIALDDEVDAEDRAHVAACLACSTEIEALQHVVLVGRSLGPEDQLTAPHPRVWQRISAKVHGGRVIPLHAAVALLEPAAPADSQTDPASADGRTLDELADRRRRTPRRRRGTVAVAAAAALVVGLGGGYVLKGVVDSGSDVASAQLNALPGWPGAAGRATVEDGANGQRTLVVDMDLPATAAVDGTLEVWMSDPRAVDMVPMGTMSGSTGRFPIAADVDIASRPIVDVSLEPPGDSNPRHSDVSVVRGRLNV